VINGKCSDNSFSFGFLDFYLAGGKVIEVSHGRQNVLKSQAKSYSDNSKKEVHQLALGFTDTKPFLVQVCCLNHSYFLLLNLHQNLRTLFWDLAYLKIKRIWVVVGTGNLFEALAEATANLGLDDNDDDDDDDDYYYYYYYYYYYIYVMVNS
jgi:hypothetical protein